MIEVPVGQDDRRRPRLDAEPLRGDAENLRGAHGQSRIDKRPLGCGLLSLPRKVYVYETDPEAGQIGRQFLNGVLRLLSHGPMDASFVRSIAGRRRTSFVRGS